jgi:response regulator RpfG family c-di-GMP phosphodiesterase
MTDTIKTEVLRLLYLDDDPMLCRAFARTASSKTLKVTTCTDPNEATSLLETESFHIVAVDYRMPQMSGVEFLETNLKRLKDTYKIMVTAMCDFETVHEAINRAGVQRYVTKPWQFDELNNVLNEAVRHAMLVVENKELQRQLKHQNSELAAINIGLNRLARERTLDVLNALVAALDHRDTETQWHSRRVALYARMIASELKIEGDELQSIEIGSMLHDVGKIGISDTILLKPGKLTDEEWVEMKKHPELGYELLAGIDFLDDARKIVLNHHERWDGSGYPHQLKEKEICIGARIFALCDTLDAITSDRPYRKRQSFEVARDEIIRHAGTQFDPKIVEAFVAIDDARWRQVIAFGHSQESKSAGQIDWTHQECDLLPDLNEAFSWQSALRQKNGS